MSSTCAAAAVTAEVTSSTAAPSAAAARGATAVRTLAREVPYATHNTSISIHTE